MNTPLKVDFTPRPRKRPSPQSKRWDYRAYYADLAARTLSSIVRHRSFIARFVAVAVALACISIPLVPRKYSAEALIYPSLFSRDEQGKVVALASVDGAAMVTGEARLIRSDTILRAVAARLGHDPKTNSRSWVTLVIDWFRGAFLPETHNYSPFDRAVAMLRNKVVVMNDTRSYLISISFTASTADEAAQVVNAFVIEYFRDKMKQLRLSKIRSAEDQLRQQLAVYGDKHPKTLQTMAELEAERAAMSPQAGDQDEVTDDQSVKLAVPNQTPTSPKGFVILGLSFLLALLAAIGVAVWRDRREAEGNQTAGYHLHPQ